MANKIYESTEIRKINNNFHTIFCQPEPSGIEMLRDHFEEIEDAKALEMLNKLLEES